MKKYPSQAKLKELFDYDPSGFLVWRERSGGKKWNSWNAKFSGKIAGSNSLRKDGSYSYSIGINNKTYSGERLVWIYHFGEINEGYIIVKKNWYSAPKVCNLALMKSRKGKTVRAKITTPANNFLGVRKRGDNGFFIAEYKDIKHYFFTEVDAATFYDNCCESDKNERPNQTKRKDVDILTKSYSKYYWASIRAIKKNGVTGIHKKRERWVARIAKKNIGSFKTKEEAARAYNIAAYEMYGDRAVLNNIPDPLGELF